MSRMRIITKLRKNHCFQGVTRLLDSLGLRWEVHSPTGKGHPFLMVEHPHGGEDVRITLASTPAARSTGRSAVRLAKHRLREAGLMDKHYISA